MSHDDSTTCLQAQCDEIEALLSIYGDAWKSDEEGSGSYGIDITENHTTVSLFLNLPDSYPIYSPPVYTISAPDLSRQQKERIATLLNNEYLANIGGPVLYQWIEKIREYLVEKDEAHTAEAVGDEQEQEAVLVQAVELNEEGESDWEVPPITHGEVIVDRKSYFQGHAARIQCVQQVKLVLETLLENKKIANATHNMYAYRVSLGNGSFQQDCEDDGECQAGGRLLHLLQIIDVSDVMVVVTRWYGGTHLGADRFRHINNAARQVLLQADIIPPSKKP